MKANCLLVLLFSLFLSSVIHAQNINFEFANIAVNPADSTVTFDVMLTATDPSTYHIAGNCYLDYNSAAFGSNVVTNGRFSMTPLTLVPSPSYTINQQDVFAGTTVNIDWLNISYAFGIPSTYIEVGLVATPLVQVTMKYLDPSEPLNISFDQGTTNGKTQYWDNVTPVIPPPLYAAPHTYGSNINIPPTSLPVEWISFTADRMDSRNIMLRWETALEVNNDHFVVQRSIDAQIFEDLGTVSGMGTVDAPTTYDYLDNTYQANINYYRLKQVDYNGTHTFSSIVEVRFDGKEEDVAFHVFPSPATSFINVESIGRVNDTYTVLIFDQTGREVYRGELNEEHTRRVIPVGKLVQGIYNYEIISGLEIKKLGRFLKL